MNNYKELLSYPSEEMDLEIFVEGMETPGCSVYRRKLNQPLRSLDTIAERTCSDLRDVEDMGV